MTLSPDTTLTRPAAAAKSPLRERVWNRLDSLLHGERHVYRPLVVLVAAGFVLRVVTITLYFPTALRWIDVVRFSRLGPWHGLFSDFYMPAGYAVFLKITHAIWANVVLTILIQHMLGLAGGVLIYCAMRRLATPQWLSLCLPRCLFSAAISSISSTSS